MAQSAVTWTGNRSTQMGWQLAYVDQSTQPDLTKGVLMKYVSTVASAGGLPPFTGCLDRRDSGGWLQLTQCSNLKSQRFRMISVDFDFKGLALYPPATMNTFPRTAQPGELPLCT